MTNALRVLELISGLGTGGAEIALVRRLRTRPADVETVLVVGTPVAEALLTDLRALNVTVVSGLPEISTMRPPTWNEPMSRKVIDGLLMSASRARCRQVA